IYPPELRSVNLDSDWLYRVAGRSIVRTFGEALAITREGLSEGLIAKAVAFGEANRRHRQPHGLLLRSWPTGNMAMWVMVMLLAYLIFYYLGHNSTPT
ncbi:MAG: hypothetical protein K9J74_09720, partial [Sulfuritalea sp.]|nr:hypothetical protein [Sulfuritalea sp.]